jgi:hypothetical protein
MRFQKSGQTLVRIREAIFAKRLFRLTQTGISRPRLSAQRVGCRLEFRHRLRLHSTA